MHHTDEWRQLLSNALEEVCGADVRDKVIPDTGQRCEGSTMDDNVRWTSRTMRILVQSVDSCDCVEVLQRCAHVLPESRIAPLREFHQRNRDVRALVEFWTGEALLNLEKDKGPLKDEWRKAIVEGGWGEAGRLRGRRIIATKVPKDLGGYFEAADRPSKALAYCHCDRIRDVVGKHPSVISAVYCNCGGGFYRSNWERIVGAPVSVKLIESVLGGGSLCRFEITLPEEVWE